MGSNGKLKFLFVQPDLHRHYIPFLPKYESLHALICEAVARDFLESSLVFDRRFDTDENLIRVLKNFEPDIVGFTAHTAGEIFNVRRLIRLVKRTFPSAMTVVGGQHATLLPEDYFDSGVDIICVGPGEETFREVAEVLANGKDLSGVKGIIWKDGNEYVINPPRPISTGFIHWPPFDRTIIPRKYRRHYMWVFEAKPNVYTISTSGCPYRCKFCSLWVTQRGTYRRRKPAEIVEDIAAQPQPYVHLTDDNTFHNEDFALELYELLKKRGIKKKILAYARTDTIIKRTYLLEKWREVGLGGLVVGMEAVTDQNLDAINKKTDVNTNIEAHRILEELGLENWAHFIMMPEFKKEDFDLVWDFIDKNNVIYPIFVPLTPMPGTPFFFEAKENDQLAVFDYGFYNLEYMVMKTVIPKIEWYRYLQELYLKTCSFETLLRRSKCKSFHVLPAVGRALRFSWAVKRIWPHLLEQVAIEEKYRYEDIEHLLPPSLRRDYKPDKYYNAPRVSDMLERYKSTDNWDPQLGDVRRLPVKTYPDFDEIVDKQSYSACKIKESSKMEKTI